MKHYLYLFTRNIIFKIHALYIPTYKICLHHIYCIFTKFTEYIYNIHIIRIWKQYTVFTFNYNIS